MSNSLRRSASVLVLSGLAVLLWGGSVTAQREKLPPPSDADIQPLTRGPVHEGFGQPITFNPKPGLVVPKKPPANVEEMPPDQKPAGNNVSWLSGYWGWDESKQDFLWVSGFWRVAPAGRQWTPGYWKEVPEGYQWVSGFWAAANRPRTEYLPQPPNSVEVGPSTEAPAPEYVWSPGYWSWQTTRYVWCPGYWVAPRVDYIWTPASYAWTPGGYVFVDGYWDYAFAGRGVLFAPVYFASPVYLTPGFYYCPSVCIEVGGLVDCLFCWPSYHHYCFGDYYASSFIGIGIYPWFSFGYYRLGCDPCFCYYNSLYCRSNPRWAHGLASDYRFRQAHPEMRPAATFAAHRQAQAGAVGSSTRPPVLAKTLSEATASRNTAVRLETLTPNARQAVAQQSRQLRQIQEQRATVESHPVTQFTSSPPSGSKPFNNGEMPRSTMAGSGGTPPAPVASAPGATQPPGQAATAPTMPPASSLQTFRSGGSAGMASQPFFGGGNPGSSIVPGRSHAAPPSAPAHHKPSH